MALNSEFVEIYKNIRGTLMSNYVLISKKLETRGMEKEIREANISTFNKYLNVSNNQGGIMNSEVQDVSRASLSEDESTVLEFVTLSLISGFYNLSNIDIENKKLTEFGFINSEKCILVLLKSIDSGFKTSACIKLSAFNSLVSIIRDKVNFSEYMSKEVYLEDVKHIKKCLEPSTTRHYFDEESEKCVLDELGGSIKNYLLTLKKVYSELMDDAFGLEKYKGVFTFNKVDGVQGISDSNGVYNVEPNGTILDYFMPPLKDNYKVHTPSDGVVIGKDKVIKYSDRQFNYDIIYKGFLNNDDIPVYFPHKMLEIISAMKYTFSIQTQVYRPSSSGNNLDAYLNYLCGSKEGSYTSDDYKKLPPMGKEILNVICCGLSTKLKDKNKERIVNKEEEVSILDIFGERDIYGYAKDFKEFAEKFAKYCIRCFTTCFCLMSINNNKRHIYDFRIRVCYPADVNYSNIAYIGDVGAPGKYSVEALLSSHAEDIQKNIIGSDIGLTFYIQDYSYCSNPKLAYGRPLFAYKAMQKMAEQGREINWKTILVGKTDSGALVTSSASSSNEVVSESTVCKSVNLQDSHIHLLIAGSRSGKGVLSYNILGTALVSGLPLFYMDRKPDTASIMKGISPEMFAINGGDYQPVFDVTNSFDPSNLPFKIPPYLKDFFGNDIKLMCDYAYLRGMLFAINLAVFMDKCTHTDNDIYKRLYKELKDGYFIVLDEFTNFTNYFLQKYIVPFSDTGKAVFYSLPKVESYKEIVSKGFSSMKAASLKLEKLKAQREEEIASGKKTKVSEGDIESSKSSLDDQIASLAECDLSKLYWNAFYDKYTSIFETWTSLKKAGGGVMKNTHLFIIGQDYEPVLFDSKQKFDDSNGKMRFNKSPIDSKLGSAVPTNLFYGFLNDNPFDIILGYQPSDIGKPSYLGQNRENFNSKANSLITGEKGFFCYKKVPDGNKSDFLYKIADTATAFKENADAAKAFVDKFYFFKPFLILNGADVPSEGYLYPNPSDHSDTEVSKALELDRKKETGSAQYVAQCITRCNKCGITFDELVADNPDVEDPSSLNKLVGFENYMNALIDSNYNIYLSNLKEGEKPKEKISLIDILGKSGQIANIIVKEILGYDGTFEDYIYDFRAEALFDWQDWDDAIGGKYSVQNSLRNSFFYPFFLTRSAGGETFASVFKDQLGSLYDYYEDTETGMSMAKSFEREEPDFDEDEDEYEEEQHFVESNNSYDSSSYNQTPTSNISSFELERRLDNYYETEDDDSEFGDYEEQEDNDEDNEVITKAMIISIYKKAVAIYDSSHPEAPIGNLITAEFLDSFAERAISILNE